jgi:hypothetical protein
LQAATCAFAGSYFSDLRALHIFKKKFDDQTNTCSHEPMLSAWFQKKAAPAGVEMKRKSVRIFPPLTEEEESNVIRMMPTSTEELAKALAEEAEWDRHWENSVAS